VRSVVRLYLGPLCGAVAQLGEHRLCKPGVVGSMPISSIEIEYDLYGYRQRTTSELFDN
jgi:hypothetical protein